MNATPILRCKTAELEHVDIDIDIGSRIEDFARNRDKTISLGHLAGTGVFASGGRADEQNPHLFGGIPVPPLGLLDSLVSSDPIDGEFVFGIGKARPCLSSSGTLAIIDVTVPRCGRETVEFILQSVESRVLKLAEKALAELVLAQCRIRRSLARL